MLTDLFGCNSRVTRGTRCVMAMLSRTVVSMI